MPVSQQFSSVANSAGMKKKKNLYAPLIQEQAKQGIATQMVMDRKNQEQQEAATQLQQDQFQFAKDQSAREDQQWQSEQALNQQQFNDQMSMQKKKQNMDMIFGGLSTAASLMDTFGGWDSLMKLF